MFDRLLDGTRIEDVVTQNGVETTVPKATPPITTSWPDAATVMSTPPFSDQVRYNSEPFYGAATSYVLLRPAMVGFPSSDTITFSLDQTNLTSAYGEQMIGPSEITVATGPFSASFRLPPGSDGSASVPTKYSAAGHLLQPRGERGQHRAVCACGGERTAGAGGAGRRRQRSDGHLAVARQLSRAAGRSAFRST